MGGDRWLNPEYGAITPHPMQDHADPPRQRNHRTPPATTTSNLCRPCPQPSRPPAVHHNGRCLAQGPAQNKKTCGFVEGMIEMWSSYLTWKDSDARLLCVRS